jgi:cytochrome P450
MTSGESLLFNPLDPSFRADPYPTYARLRAEDSVHHAPWGGWLVSRYADCVAMLKDARASSDMSASPAYQRAREQGLFDPDEALARTPPFLILDPPDHTRLRGLVSKAFTPKAIEQARPRVQRIVDELLDCAAERRRVELIEEIAYPLPVQAICGMLGVPPEDHETFAGWSRLLSQAMDPQPITPPETIAARRDAGNAFAQYFRDLIAERRKRPGDDLLSKLIAVEEAGDVLSEDELISTCILLLAAGHETTVSLIGNGVLALLRHPEELRRLQHGRSLARSAVEEVLRYDAPVQFAIRTAKEGIELDGHVIAEGDQLLLLLASANRDATQFPEPDRFDVTRNESRHLAFGHGIHFCLGAPLARLEGELFFATLARRFSRVSLRTEAPQYAPNIVNRRLAELPIEVTI